MSRVISCWVGGNKHGSHVITSKNLKKTVQKWGLEYINFCVWGMFLSQRRKKLRGKSVYLHKDGYRKDSKSGGLSKVFF